MQAIEFETYISQNLIKVPLDFNYLNNTRARVSIKIDDELQQGNYNKSSLLKAFVKAKTLEVFKNIENSITWQQELRNEWK